MHKILLFSPISQAKAYILPKWIRWIKALGNLQPATCNLQILLIDNSPNRKLEHDLRKIGIHCEYHNPKGKRIIDIIAACQERAREYAMEKNFDFLFSLECDVFPPVQMIIDLLLQHRKPVVSATYFIEYGPNSQLCLQQRYKDTFTRWQTYFNLDHGTWLIDVDGSLKTGQQAGLGCTLIHRSVLEKIKFRTEPDKIYPSDSYFYTDLDTNGIPYFVDTSLLCQHYSQPWAHDSYQEKSKV